MDLPITPSHVSILGYMTGYASISIHRYFSGIHSAIKIHGPRHSHGDSLDFLFARQMRQRLSQRNFSVRLNDTIQDTTWFAGLDKKGDTRRIFWVWLDHYLILKLKNAVCDTKESSVVDISAIVSSGKQPIMTTRTCGDPKLCALRLV